MQSAFFNSLHRYALILTLAKKIMDDASLDASSGRVGYLMNNRLFNNAFCGLIRGGYPFYREESGFLALVIDGEVYRCPEKSISNILRDEFPRVMEMAGTSPSEPDLSAGIKTGSESDGTAAEPSGSSFVDKADEPAPAQKMAKPPEKEPETPAPKEDKTALASRDVPMDQNGEGKFLKGLKRDGEPQAEPQSEPDRKPESAGKKKSAQPKRPVTETPVSPALPDWFDMDFVPARQNHTGIVDLDQAPETAIQEGEKNPESAAPVTEPSIDDGLTGIQKTEEPVHATPEPEPEETGHVTPDPEPEETLETSLDKEPEKDQEMGAGDNPEGEKEDTAPEPEPEPKPDPEPSANDASVKKEGDSGQNRPDDPEGSLGQEEPAGIPESITDTGHEEEPKPETRIPQGNLFHPKQVSRPAEDEAGLEMHSGEPNKTAQAESHSLTNRQAAYPGDEKKEDGDHQENHKNEKPKGGLFGLFRKKPSVTPPKPEPEPEMPKPDTQEKEPETAAPSEEPAVKPKVQEDLFASQGVIANGKLIHEDKETEAPRRTGNLFTPKATAPAAEHTEKPDSTHEAGKSWEETASHTEGRPAVSRKQEDLSAEQEESGKLFVHVHNVLVKKKFGNGTYGPYRFIFWPIVIPEPSAKRTFGDFLLHITGPDKQEYIYVTNHRETTLRIRLDDKEFDVYSIWDHGKFGTYIVLAGKTASIFEIEDKAWKSEPDGCDHDVFLDQFRLMRKGQPKHFVVPFRNRNKGEDNIPIIGYVEIADDRKPLSPMEGNMLSYKYSGNIKTIQGHWENGRFAFTVNNSRII